MAAQQCLEFHDHINIVWHKLYDGVAGEYQMMDAGVGSGTRIINTWEYAKAQLTQEDPLHVGDVRVGSAQYVQDGMHGKVEQTNRITQRREASGSPYP